MKKTILISLSLVLIGGLATVFFLYKKIYSPAIKKDTIIYVKTGSSLENLVERLKPSIENIGTFKKVAEFKKFKTPKAGKFKLFKGMNYNQLVNRLRQKGDLINIQFNNQHRLENLASRIAKQIEADSLTILNEMKEPAFLKKHHFTEKDAIAMYIPNKYEVYWNTSPKDFKMKMLHYFNKFWNENRREKAKKIGLTPKEVIVLASIVQKETAKVSERPIVAGLYLNRYYKKHPLQADPTVIFALKEKNGHDKVYKRVLKKDLLIDSPYNTYKNVGLPPAPIAMPDISSIDAVLNPAKHNYFFMCASTKKLGFHNFAVTLAEHNRNAREYQCWISKQGIKR